MKRKSKLLYFDIFSSKVALHFLCLELERQLFVLSNPEKEFTYEHILKNLDQLNYENNLLRNGLHTSENRNKTLANALVEMAEIYKDHVLIHVRILNLKIICTYTNSEF